MCRISWLFMHFLWLFKGKLNVIQKFQATSIFSRLNTKLLRDVTCFVCHFELRLPYSERIHAVRLVHIRYLSYPAHRFWNRSTVSCLALWVNGRAMICEAISKSRTSCTRSGTFIMWRPPGMNIFLVDVQLSSIKEDSLSCFPLFLSLQPRSHTEVIHIGKPPHPESRMGTSRSLFCFPDVCKKD